MLISRNRSLFQNVFRFKWMPNLRSIIFIHVVFALVQSFTFDKWLRSLEYNHICCSVATCKRWGHSRTTWGWSNVRLTWVFHNVVLSSPRLVQQMFDLTWTTFFDVHLQKCPISRTLIFRVRSLVLNYSPIWFVDSFRLVRHLFRYCQSSRTIFWWEFAREKHFQKLCASSN